MSILQKNIEKYKVKLSSTEYSETNFIHDNDEELIKQPDFNINRALYLAFEITSIKVLFNLLSSLNEKSLVFLYYRDERYLFELLSKVDFTEKDYNIVFFSGDYKDSDKSKELDDLLGSISYSFTNIQPVIKVSLDIEYLRSARTFLEFIRYFRQNFNFLLGNDLNDTLVGIEHRLKNLPRYVTSPGLKEFKEKFGELYKNKPAVVVSSGPSLDKNVHHLRDYRDQILVLSCDGSLSTLEKNGIIPDVVGSVERAYLTYEAFYKDKVLNENIVFSGPAVIRPEIVDMFNKENVLSVFKDKDVYGKWMNEITLDKKGTIWAGSSVAHFLMNLADNLGCNPIILIGQDLAYTNDGISHAGATEFKENVDVSKVTEWVKDYYGNDIPTSRIWKNFLLTFEDMIRLTDKTIIDATEGGALIQGTEIQCFKEVLEQYCGERLPGFVNLLRNIPTDHQYISMAKNSSFTGILKGIECFEELLGRLKKALKDNKSSLSVISKGIKTQKQLDRIYDALEYVDNEVVKQIAKSPFLMMLFQYPIYSTARAINALDTNQFTLENIEYNLQLHNNLLETFEDYTNKMIKVLINGLLDNKAFFEGTEGFESAIDKLSKEYDYLYKSDKYDTTFIYG